VRKPIATESTVGYLENGIIFFVNGKEVTPFLNSLKRDSHVYYNGKMHENVTIGESSDGQFIYMTGLLPLRAIVTISKARKIILPGLPKKLGKVSRMVIPTVTSLWNQDEMCRQYGFNSLYSSKDYAGSSNLNDEQVIQLAMQKDNVTDMPFFSVTEVSHPLSWCKKM
jgi:lipoteichoic acid synthase